MSKRGRADDAESVSSAIELLCSRPALKGEAEGLRLTPLEQQVVALKQSIPRHVILMVACGYRVKFYGRDSRVASRRTGIMCIPGQPFEYSSVPYTRVNLYVHRLISMGYHVGFADQESAAVRAADGVKSGIFTRVVSQLYSRGTLLPMERVMTNGDGEAPSGGGGDGEELEDAGGKGGADGEEGEMARGDVAGEAASASFSPSGGIAVDSSELFLCFVQAEPCDSATAVEGPASKATLHLVLISFVSQRREVYQISSALELEDIVQRLDIVELIILTPVPPLSDARGELNVMHQRTTAAYLRLLPEKYVKALLNSANLHFGPTGVGEEDSKSVSVSGFHHTRGETTDDAIQRYLEPYRLNRVYAQMCCRQSGSNCSIPHSSPLAGELSCSADAAAAAAGATPLEMSAADVSLHLPGPTLRALDVFHSSVGVQGSLLHLLDRCMVPCGARLLRRWLAAPLATMEAILRRQAAVQFLMQGSDGGQVEDLLQECRRLGDVEAVAAKLHAQKCLVPEFIRLLRMVRSVSMLGKAWCGQPGASTLPLPPLLRQLLEQTHDTSVTVVLQEYQAALRSSATTPLELLTDDAGGVPAMLRPHVEAKKAAEAALATELEVARQTLRMPGLQYRSVNGTPFVLDLPHTKVSLVPPTWTVLTRTKANVRYHTPVIVEQNIALCAATERLATAAGLAWREKQRGIVEESTFVPVLHRIIEAVASFDVLRSLSIVSQQTGYVAPRLFEEEARVEQTCVPVAEPTTPRLLIRAGRHPILDRLLPNGYVSCDVEVPVGGAWLLTGPNMGGKSALMRMIGTFSVLAQLGCSVPADEAVLPVFQGVYCRMGASDSILEGSSTFLSEMDETSRILRTPILSRSLVLMDELGRGTSSFDGAAVAAAALEYLIAKRATTFFVTHYSYLCDPYLHHPRDTNVGCFYMGYTETEARTAPDGSDGGARSPKRLVFTYKPCRGVTPSSFGVAIGRMAGLPHWVTEAASRLSSTEEEEHRLRRELCQVRSFLQSCDPSGDVE